MRKKLLSLALALALCLGLAIPAAASSVEVLLSEEDGIWEIREFSDGMAAVLGPDVQLGYADQTGTLVIPYQYGKTSHDFHDGLALVTADSTAFSPGVQQFIDKTGKVVIEENASDFTLVGDFYEGLARVQKDGKYGYIDKTGKVVIDFLYSGPSGQSGGVDACAFHEGLARVYDPASGYWGFIDKTGRAVVPFQYTDAEDFSGGMALVYSKSRGYGYVNTSGQEVVPCQYAAAESFSGNLARVSNSNVGLGLGMTGDTAVIDKNGNIVVSAEKYQRVGAFQNGLATVESKENHKLGFIDETGAEVIPCQFDYVNSWAFKSVTAVMLEDGGQTRFGILSRNGQVAWLAEGLSPDIEHGVGDGFVAVRNLEDRYGFVNAAGELVVPCKYSKVGVFSEGYAPVANFEPMNGNTGAWGYVDAAGNEVVPCQYEKAGTVHDGFASAVSGKVSPGGTWLRFPAAASTQTTQPTAPSVPVTPAPTGSVSAAPTASKVLVNGKDVSFDAYTIDGSNYFKLRDLAFVLNGTEKQFEVGWDNASKTIALTSGSAYTANGSEMAKGSGAQSAAVSASKLLIDGKEVSLTAYTIGGNNYFKLRDIGQAFDFGIGWDNASKTITIDTSTGYTA